MFQVVKNNVKIVRGDTGEMELSLTLEDGTAIDPAAYTAVFSLKKSIDDVAAGTDAQFEEISKYIRFVDGNIVLGEEGNTLTLQIANDRISFLDSGQEVAYFSNRKLYVTDTEILHSLQLGNFAFMPRANGNLSFKLTT
jgi:hypothetical protein